MSKIPIFPNLSAILASLLGDKIVINNVFFASKAGFANYYVKVQVTDDTKPFFVVYEDINVGTYGVLCSKSGYTAIGGGTVSYNSSNKILTIGNGTNVMRSAFVISGSQIVSIWASDN